MPKLPRKYTITPNHHISLVRDISHARELIITAQPLARKIPRLSGAHLPPLKISIPRAAHFIQRRFPQYFRHMRVYTIYARARGKKESRLGGRFRHGALGATEIVARGGEDARVTSSLESRRDARMGVFSERQIDRVV